MKKVVPQDAVLIPDSATRVFQGTLFDTYQWQQKQFDGSTKTFEMLKRPDSVTVIGIVDDKLLVIDEDQSHRGKKTTFPSGRVDRSDTSLLDAIKRELLEETGYTFRNWKLVNVFQPQVKIEWFVHAYVAWDVESVARVRLDSGERINLHLVEFSKAKQIVEDDIGYLGEAHKIFKLCKNSQEMQNLPEFQGKVVDR